MDDEKLIDRTIEDMQKLGIIDEDKVVYSRVKRVKYAYVIDDLDYLKNIGIIIEYMKGIDLDLVGRFAEFRYLNMDGCIRRTMDYVRSVE